MMSRKLAVSRRVLTAGAVVAAVAGGGSAVALATAGSGSNVYQGCLRHEIGTVYRVELNPSTPPVCGRHDTLITWNQTGPQGATGPAGRAAGCRWPRRAFRIGRTDRLHPWQPDDSQRKRSR